MWSITLKLMRKTKRMLIPAGIAILIGTAFIASTFLFGNAMGDSLARQMTAMFGGANYAATANVDGLSDKEIDKAYSVTVGDFHVDQLKAVEGVKAVRVASESAVTVSSDDDNVSGELITGASDASMLPVRISQGSQPKDANEIALPEQTAKTLGVNVGDTVTLTSRYATTETGGKAKANDVRVVGLTADPEGAYSFYGGAIVGSDNLIALMQGADDFNAVNATAVYFDFAMDGNTVAAKTLNDVQKLLPAHYELSSRQNVSDEAVKSLGGNGTNVVTIFLMCFGILAMFVAALVIANTFQVLVAQRRRTLALLRTIGAKKGQLYRSVLFEACALGLISSVLGVAFGSLIMWGMCAGNVIRQGMRLIFSWQVFVVPIIFGIIMTMLAALGSARSATSVTPLEALRPIELTDTKRAGIVRAVLGILMVVAGIAMAVFSVWRIQSTNGGQTAQANEFTMAVLIAIAGAALIFLGMVLTAVFWLPALMKGAGTLVSLAGPSAKIAHGNIQKNPRRIAATGAALLIGVTLVSTIATGAASVKQTMNNTLATRYSVDVVASGEDLTQGMADKVAGIKGVTDTVYAPAASVTLNGTDAAKPTTVLLIGVKNIDQVKHVMRVDLGDTSLGADDVLMPSYNAQTGKKLAFANGKAEFDTTRNKNGDMTRPLTLRVTQRDYRRIFDSYGAVGFVDERHFANGDLDTTTHMLLVKADTDQSGTSVNDLYDGIQSALSKSADAAVSGPIAERVTWAQMIDSMMMLMVGLIAVAVLVALIGVANTLSLSVIERTRESATLRAIGMTRGQLRASLAIEALLISLVSGIAGILLGTLFGWLGAYVVFSLYGTVVFPFEWGVNGIVLAVAAVAALLASIAPARRAVKVPPVEALAEA
uniref:ABC transporter permease n=1 Tax=Bifidobacterium adolescentis TaxID=1680 RepID=UPI003FEEF1B8